MCIDKTKMIKEELNKSFVWDIETCMDSEVERDKPLRLQKYRCWSYAINRVSNDEVISVKNTIEQALKDMIDIAQSIKNPIFYAHNAKFDVSYLKPILLGLGFVNTIPTYDEFGDREKEPIQPYSFEICETKTHQFYFIKVVIDENIQFVIRDSYKKMPLSVKDLATSFKLDTLKGDLDYNLIRPTDHIITEEELDYLKNDVIIVSKCLRFFIENGYTKITISSDAFQTWKELTFGKSLEAYTLQFNKFNEVKGTNKRMTVSKQLQYLNKKFREYFPVVSEEVDHYLRKSYRGGITYVNPRFKGLNKRLKGLVYDVNSLYPSVMFDNLLPYGLPVHFKGKYKNDPKYPLFICRVSIDYAELKNINTMPFIQIKNQEDCRGTIYKATEFLSQFADVTLTMTSKDLELFLKHYNVFGITYLDGFKFMANKNFFKNYITKFINDKMKYGQKETANPGLRQIAKLMLNSLYGKFGTNPHKETLLNELDEYGVVTTRTAETHTDEPNYVAMASFITAYAREFLINGVYSIPFEKFYYCDTDSIHYNNEGVKLDSKTFPIDVNKTGDLNLWKLEGEFIDAKYLGSKKYMELIREDEREPFEWDVKCCGLPWEVRDEIATSKNPKKRFSYGQIFEGKKSQLNGVGGIRIVDGTYTLNEHTLLRG